MSFIVPIMAFGALAAAVPVIIHLLNRSRYRVVMWGAMHLLDSVVRVNRRRIRIEQLILLFVRAGIPLAIALFMAKPVITGWRALPGEVKSSLVALLDNSYSMEAGGGDQSNFFKAKHELVQIVGSLKRGSDVSVVTMAGEGGPSFEKPTFNLRALGRDVRELAGGYGKAEVPGSFEDALGRFADMNHSHRQMVVFSDFQRVSWDTDEAPDRRRLAELLDTMEVKPSLTLFRIGSRYGENVCVESLTLSKFVVGVGQKVQVKGILKNYGTKTYAALRVHFRVDGGDRETSEITLGPGERGQVMFVYTFEKPGSHYVEVTADADPLKADNTLFAAIPVWDTIPVLLVTDETDTEPLEGEIDYIGVALGPYAAGKTKLSDLIEAQAIETDKLTAERLSEKRVLVLANVKKLAAAQLDVVDAFVQSGGGLLVFPGDRCDRSWYNTTFAGRGLPVRFSSLIGSLTERMKQTTIVAEHFDHPALTMFNIPENGTLAGGEVWQWYRLDDAGQPTPSSTQDPAPGAGGKLTVLAKLATGDPFLVERKHGGGRVIVSATACDADWGNMPMRPFYLPLMQQLTTYVASSVYPPRNVQVGKLLVAFLPIARAGAKLNVTLPDGSTQKIESVDRGTRAVVTFSDTDRPGLYVFSGGGVEPIHFVVNTARFESDLDQLADEELAAVAADLGADVVTSSSAYMELESTRRHGREIWRHLFWGALILLFSEVFLQQLFARRRA